MSTGTGPRMPACFRVLDGARVRFAGTGADSGTTVLMPAPRPGSARAFRRIRDRLTSPGRVAAIDMPGFGHPDQPPGLIAPGSSGAFLAGPAGQGGPGAPHIAGPDAGTAAALFLAARAPERVTSLTTGGGAVRSPVEAGGALKDTIEAPRLDDVRGPGARTNTGHPVQPAAPGDTEPEAHQDYVSAYDPGRLAEPARFARHYPEQHQVPQDLPPATPTPAPTVAGQNDELVPWPNNQNPRQLPPHSEIHPPDTGHFAREQAAQQHGRPAAGRVSGGYRRVTAG